MIECLSCKHEPCAKKVPIFSFLDDNEIQKIISKIRRKTFQKGEVIFHEGDISNILYIINDGKIKLSKYTLDGKEQIIHILSNGDFFGELSLFTENNIVNFNAYAISDVILCTIAKKDMDEILLNYPHITLKILNEVGKRLQETENLAQNLATNDIEIRIAYMIQEFSEKYGKKTDKGIEINCPINREEMANYIGVSRETISRKLRKFSDLGIIELIGNKIMLIKDEETLNTYLY